MEIDKLEAYLQYSIKTNKEKVLEDMTQFFNNKFEDTDVAYYEEKGCFIVTGPHKEEVAEEILEMTQL